MKFTSTLFTTLLSICVFGTNTSLAQAVSTQDSLTLVELYNSTNGANWLNIHNKWLTSAPVKEWLGVKLVLDAGTDSLRVSALQLPYQNLIGPIPSSLSNLTFLTVLDLSINGLKGGIPGSLSTLTKLKELNLSYNSLGGAIPNVLGNLTRLASLNLANNQFTGVIPKTLARLVNLTNLNLSRDSLGGEIPAELAQLTNLKILDLSINKLTGSIPSVFGNMDSLTTLALNNNQLSGTIPASIGNLANLSYLQLFSNNLSGNIPAELGNLQKLTYLEIGNNQFTGNIPSALGNCSALISLSLSANQLTGNIPSALGNLTNLNYLYLGLNKLDGALPTSLGKLYNLTSLIVSSNSLTGNIPAELSKLKQLVFFELNDNHLSGAILPEVVSGAKLGMVDFSNNQLSGAIPSFTSKKLRSLNLSNNQFTGNAPTFNSNELSLLNLSNNLLSYIPDLSSLKILTNIQVQNNNLTFDGIEPLAPKTGITFIYAPQGTIPIHRQNDVLSVSAGGTLSNNIYTWYKDGLSLATINADSTFTFTENGKYNVAVTNSVAKQLTLYSDTINIEPLPVTLLSFTGAVKNQTAVLSWQTTHEINAALFNIQRSINATDFKTIGSLKSTGNTNSVNSYHYNDDIASLKATTIYYRLQQADKDGKTAYSNIVTLHTGNSLAYFSPNPAHNMVYINSTNAKSVYIYSLSGKMLIHKQLINSNGINISRLAKGIYIIKVLGGDNKISTEKMVVE